MSSALFCACPTGPHTSSSSARRRMALASCCAASLAASSACSDRRGSLVWFEREKKQQVRTSAGNIPPSHPPCQLSQASGCQHCRESVSKGPRPSGSSAASLPAQLLPCPYLQACQRVCQQAPLLLLLLHAAAAHAGQLAAQLAGPQLLLVQLVPAAQQGRGRRNGKNLLLPPD